MDNDESFNSERNLYAAVIEEFKFNILRIDSESADLQSRSTSLIAIASLVSIASLGKFDVNYLNYYLQWILPYLIITLVLFFVSILSIRSIHVTNMAFGKGDSKKEAELLKTVAQFFREIHERLLENFKFRQILLRISTITILLFFMSFFVNLYLFAVQRPFSLQESIIFNLILILVGFLTHFFMKNYKSKTVTHTLVQEMAKKV